MERIDEKCIEDKEEKLIELRKRMNAHCKLKTFRKDDEFLLRYLRITNFNVNHALKKMEKFYGILVKNPEWHCTKGPSNFIHILKMNAKAVLDSTDKCGRRIILSRLGNMVVPEIDPLDSARFDEVLLESILDEPLVQQKGVCFVMDVSNVSWKMIKWMTPHNTAVSVKRIEVYPLVDFMLHVINGSAVLNTAVKITFPFLPEYVKTRIKFHGSDMESLHQHIDKDILPPEYGGTALLDWDLLNQQLLMKDDYIIKNFQYYKDTVLEYENNCE